MLKPDPRTQTWLDDLAAIIIEIDRNARADPQPARRRKQRFKPF